MEKMKKGLQNILRNKISEKLESREHNFINF